MCTRNCKLSEDYDYSVFKDGQGVQGGKTHGRCEKHVWFGMTTRIEDILGDKKNRTPDLPCTATRAISKGVTLVVGLFCK